MRLHTAKGQKITCLVAAEEGLVTCEISIVGSMSLKKRKQTRAIIEYQEHTIHYFFFIPPKYLVQNI